MVEWTDKDNSLGKAALCPNCGIAAILGENSGVPIADKNLWKL